VSVSQLLELPQANRYLAGQITALDYAYPPGDLRAHPLIGTRVPDLTLDSPLTDRLFPLLHHTHHVLLNLTGTPVTLPAPGPARRGPGAMDATEDPTELWTYFLNDTPGLKGLFHRIELNPFSVCSNRRAARRIRARTRRSRRNLLNQSPSRAASTSNFPIAGISVS
jgi:hypothetical protein